MPGAVAPLNDRKTDGASFLYLQGCVVRCEDAARLQQEMQFDASQSWQMRESEMLLTMNWNSLLFIYFSFRSCDFRLHRPNEFKAPTLIYNAVSFLLGPADEIFGFIWLNYGTYFSFFFCLKGNAVLLIKPRSKLVLQLSVEKQSRAMEPSKCQRIITE